MILTRDVSSRKSLNCDHHTVLNLHYHLAFKKLNISKGIVILFRTLASPMDRKAKERCRIGQERALATDGENREKCAYRSRLSARRLVCLDESGTSQCLSRGALATQNNGAMITEGLSGSSSLLSDDWANFGFRSFRSAQERENDKNRIRKSEWTGTAP
jgi:hypothetical protein